MTRLSRDSWLAIGLFTVLLLVTVVAAIQQTQEQAPPPLVSSSSTPNGARALYLWLDELGYPVSNDVPDAFMPDKKMSTLLMLEPYPGVSASEWETIDNWVEAGGVLILAGDSLGAAMAFRHYQVSIVYTTPTTNALTVQAPLFASPPAEPAAVQTAAYLKTIRDDAVTLMAVEKGPVIIVFERGAGRVLLSAAPFPFSNAGLKEAGNPALVLNVISAAGRQGEIWFDEWHHGRRLKQTRLAGPGNWLRYTPAGRSFLFVGLVIFVALALKGRRFGRPVPLSKDIARRAPLEYITAIANLNRRAGHRSTALSRYRYWLKRDLGRRYRLSPTLPDEEYLTQLLRFNPELDASALRDLLNQLNRRTISESDMIRAAAAVADRSKEI